MDGCSEHEGRHQGAPSGRQLLYHILCCASQAHSLCFAWMAQAGLACKSKIALHLFLGTLAMTKAHNVSFCPHATKIHHEMGGADWGSLCTTGLNVPEFLGALHHC